MLPLLNTQGHVKALVLLLNRSWCSCERQLQLEEAVEEQCSCSAEVRAFESPLLALVSWGPAALPCERCNRKREEELSYGEYLTRIPSSLNVDCSRHFIRQAKEISVYSV